MPERARASALALVLICIAGPATAHSPIEGIEGFYTGMIHPLTTVAQVVALVAIGLCFGQRGTGEAGAGFVFFAGGCLLGIVLGQVGVPFDWAETGLLALALGLGALAALWPTAPRPFAIGGAALGGLMVGLVSTPDPGPVRATWMTLSGSLVGAVVLALYAVGGFGWLHERATTGWRWTQAWAATAFRVGAAWSAAIAALTLAVKLAGEP